MATVRKWDVCTPRPKHGGGTWWLKLGSAIENDEGKITVFLNAAPLPDKESGEIKLMLFEPKDRDESAAPRAGTGGGRASGTAARRKPAREDDDEIPF